MADVATTVETALRDKAPDTAAARKVESQEALKVLLRQTIDAINSRSDIPQHMKAGLVNELETMLSSGNLSQAAIMQVVQGVRSETNEAAQDAYSDAMMGQFGSSSYPGYKGYSREARQYIERQQEIAYAASPELRASRAQLDAMPAAERESAANEQNQTQEKIEDMLHGSRKDEFAGIAEQIRVYRSTGLANGADGQKTINALLSGELSQEDFRAKVYEDVHKSAQKNDAFVNNDMMKKIPQASHDALLKEFGDGQGENHINTGGVMVEWGKLKRSEKDSALKALHDAGGDESKLSPAQQRIVHMSHIAIAIETKNTVEGALDIIGRNQALTKDIANPALSVDERVEKLDAALRASGSALPRDQYHYEALRQTVLAIDESVKEGKAYNSNDSAGFIKKVSENIKENYDELLGKKGAGNESQRYSNTDLLYYSSLASSEQAAPDWIARDPVKLAEYNKQVAEWDKIHDKMSGAYTPAAQAANSIDHSQMVSRILTPAEQKKADDELRASNPMKAWLDEQAATGQAQGRTETPPTAATPSAPAAAATPTTMSVEALRAAELIGANLGAAGVTGGATTLVPPSVVVATALQPQRGTEVSV